MPQLLSFLELSHKVSVAQTIVLATFILLIIYYFLKFRGVPPGPWGIPFIGYWPFLKTEGGHLQFLELQRKYGDVFSFTVTGNLFISLNTIKAIKEAHITKAECFGDRFTDYSLITASFKEGVAVENGESWRVQRKFFAQKFKEYGMMAVKEDMTGALYDALRETVEEINATKGQPFVTSDLLTGKCSVILRRMLFNDQGITEEELKEINHEFEPVLVSMTHKNMLLMGNFARYTIFPLMKTYAPMIRAHNRIQSMLNKIIMRQKSAFDETQVLDIIDSFYKEKKDREKKGDPTAKYFTDQALISSVYQFLTDGVLTVAVFIDLFLQYLVLHPEEQDKIYAELLEVCPNRQPSVEDKGKLPYANAFIYEVIRYSEFSPSFPSQMCTRETIIHGYRIPKGAITVINLWSAHRDPNVYEDVDKFDPSRFMTKPGKQRSDPPIMFGIGKRACMGEPFTMLQTFLFLTTIIKNFHLTKVGEHRSLAATDVGGLKICAHPRNPET